LRLLSTRDKSGLEGREQNLSGTQPSGSSETVLLIVAFIIIAAIRRVYRTYRGSRFSFSRTVVFACIYVGIGVFFSISSFFEGVSVYYAPVYALVLAGSAVASFRFADRRITFWRAGDGSVYFKGGVIIYLVYLVALIVRLTVDFVVIGPSVFSYAPGLTLSGGALEATVVVDVLLMLGVGLLLGRNARVLMRYRRIESGEDKIQDSSSPLGSEGPATGGFTGGTTGP
jgi:hypothetical protein